MADNKSRKRLTRRPRLQKGLSIIPSLFTVGNMFCGFYAILASFRGDYDSAAIAIGLGIVLDGLDGRVARLTGTASEFGVQLDSLADVLTFGAAPAVLAFSWGLGNITGVEEAMAVHARRLVQLSTFVFVMCSALRLARFNIQSQKPADTAAAAGKRYFVGLATPASAGLIAAIVHYFKTPVLSVNGAIGWGVLLLAASFLMISTVRYYSFKELNVMKRGPRAGLAATALMIGLILSYSEIVLLTMAVVYVTSGPIGKLIQFGQRLGSGRVRSNEPAHGNLKT
jgi:CDP-diacylglycerol--serine O-phosphatidyltransferase